MLQRIQKPKKFTAKSVPENDRTMLFAVLSLYGDKRSEELENHMDDVHGF